jgi:predicted nucleotidyltransferase
MPLSSELEEWSKLIAAWAEAKPKIMEVWLFGSRVRGVSRPDSDLDVAVVVFGDTLDARYTVWHFSVDEWSIELNALLPVQVDLDLGNPEISTKIVGPALKREGIRIFSRSKEG